MAKCFSTGTWVGLMFSKTYYKDVSVIYDGLGYDPKFPANYPIK